jgi:hypothetical protein
MKAQIVLLILIACTSCMHVKEHLFIGKIKNDNQSKSKSLENVCYLYYQYENAPFMTIADFDLKTESQAKYSVYKKHINNQLHKSKNSFQDLSQFDIFCFVYKNDPEGSFKHLIKEYEEINVKPYSEKIKNFSSYDDYKTIRLKGDYLNNLDKSSANKLFKRQLDSSFKGWNNYCLSKKDDVNMIRCLTVSIPYVYGEYNRWGDREEAQKVEQKFIERLTKAYKNKTYPFDVGCLLSETQEKARKDFELEQQIKS